MRCANCFKEIIFGTDVNGEQICVDCLDDYLFDHIEEIPIGRVMEYIKKIPTEDKLKLIRRKER